MQALAAAGNAPDYQRLAADVLGIRGAPPALARKLVEQALLLTDWREHWRRVGQRALRDAPAAPGVYVFRDSAGRALYVGKAANLQRRLTAHFGGRRWMSMPPALARVTDVEWEALGSDLEAILREASLIRDLQPVVNVQTGPSSLATRAIAPALIRDVILLLPSIQPDAAEIVAVSVAGAVIQRRMSRECSQPHSVSELWVFFSELIDGSADQIRTASERTAPLVFSWLAGRGHRTTRLDPHECASESELAARLDRLLRDRDLFVDRVIAQ
jgi:hypothetical protein